MKTRRAFLVAGAAGLCALATALASLAQQSPGKVRRIGYLGSGGADAAAKPLEALRAGLRDLGYTEGRNIIIEYRYAEGKFDRLPDLVADLLRHKVELIIVWGTPAALAARRATATLPIVMVSVGDPVDTGLIASLPRPGGNVTGTSNLGGAVVAKQLELLTEVLSKLARIAVLRNPENPSLVPQVQGAEGAARALGLQLRIFDVRSPTDLDAAFEGAATARSSAVLVLAEPLFFDQRRVIAALARKYRLPTVTARSEIVDAGVLMSYGASAVQQYRDGARYVDRILRGAKPADLPVEQATTFELVINLKTAKALGITIPQTVLYRADRVIE